MNTRPTFPATTSDELVTASYTIPESYKARIELMAKVDPDRANASIIMRRILREHFARVDGVQLALPARQFNQPSPVAA